MCPVVCQNDETDGIKNKIRLRNDVDAKAQTSNGLLSRGLVPLCGKESSQESIVEVKKQKSMAIIAQKSVIR